MECGLSPHSIYTPFFLPLAAFFSGLIYINLFYNHLKNRGACGFRGPQPNIIEEPRSKRQRALVAMGFSGFFPQTHSAWIDALG